MTNKKACVKRPREITCPTSEVTEPGAEVTMSQNCCEGTCPIDKNAGLPVAPEPTPVVVEEGQQIAETANDVLQNETEIVIEDKPAKKHRKSKNKTAVEEKVPKAPNAYMLFYQDELKKEDYKGIALQARAKMIGAVWRQMDDDARAPFQERVAKAKEALNASA